MAPSGAWRRAGGGRTYRGCIHDDDLLRAAADVEPGLLDRLEVLGRAVDAALTPSGEGVDPATALHELATVVLAQVCAGSSTPAGLVGVVRHDMVHVVASQGVSGTALVRFPVPVDDPQPVCRAVSTGRAVWGQTTTDRPSAGELPAALGCVPILRHGRAVGVIVVGHYGPHAFTSAERSFCAAAGALVAEAVHHLALGDEATSGAVTAVADELPAFLRSVSAGLSGDTVAFDQLDLAAGTVTTLFEHEVNPTVRAEVAPGLAVPQPIAGSILERAIEAAGPVFVPTGLAEPGADAELPAAWARVADQFPVHGLIAVPVRLDDRVVGVLLAGRRRPGLPYAPADLEFVLASAHRLEGLLQQVRLAPRPEATPTPHEATGARPAVGPHLDGRFDSDVSWPTAIACGVVVPAFVTLLLRRLDDPGELRPASMLLAVMVALTVLVGFRAGLVAAITAVSCLALFLTQPYESIEVASWGELWGLGAFSVASAGVLVLVERLRRIRRTATRERLVTEALLDGSPIGIALLDRDLRIVDVNDRICEMTGRPRRAHLGLTPTELAPGAGIHESQLREVLETGRRVDDDELSLVDPGAGIERYWRASFFPVRDLDGAVSGVGVSLEEVTSLTIAQRRAEALLELSTALAGVSDADGFAVEVIDFVSRAFNGRGAVAFVDPDGANLRVHVGEWSPSSPRPGPADRAAPRRVPLSMPLALTEAVITGQVVEIPDRATAAARYPSSTAQRAAQGSHAWVSVPLRDPFDPDTVVGAFQVAWPHPRELTSHSRTLLATIGALAELALSRIRIAEAGEQDRFRTVLDAMVDSVVLACAVRDDSGTVIDFVIEYANAMGDGRGRSGADLVGQRVGALHPGWVGSVDFHRFVDVVESGRPMTLERERYDSGTHVSGRAAGYWNVQVAPFGPDRYIASTRDVTEIVLAEAATRDAAALEERERVAVELLQRAALPERLPAMAGTRIGALYQPASDQAVGGDWYDAFAIDDDRLALVIADVAGHGPEAAAFMVQVRNIFRAAAVEHVEPATVLSRVNRIVLRLRPSELFVTCCYAVLDTRRGELSWAVAGHPPPVVVAGGTTRLGDTVAGPPLAVFDDARYRSTTIAFRPGDRLHLYTDGLVERRDEPLDVGLERLCRRVEGLADVSPQAAVDALGAQVEDQFDDLALLCVDLG